MATVTEIMAKIRATRHLPRARHVDALERYLRSHDYRGCIRYCQDYCIRLPAWITVSQLAEVIEIDYPTQPPGPLKPVTQKRANLLMALIAKTYLEEHGAKLDKRTLLSRLIEECRTEYHGTCGWAAAERAYAWQPSRHKYTKGRPKGK
jgi:hypothetical protein